MDTTTYVYIALGAVATGTSLWWVIRTIRRRLTRPAGGSQSVNVKQLRVRLTTLTGEIFDISFEGKAFYINDTIWMQTAKEIFNDWRDAGEHGLFRVSRNQWIGAQNVKELLLVKESDLFIDVPYS
jgi:hypothetical protein